MRNAICGRKVDYLNWFPSLQNRKLNEVGLPAIFSLSSQEVLPRSAADPEDLKSDPINPRSKVPSTSLLGECKGGNIKWKEVRVFDYGVY
jgi:hypothetical protein